MDIGIQGPEFIVVFGLISAALVGFGLWLWSLIACIRNPFLSDNNRVIGLILIVVLG